jgi:hypothetical protein
MHFKYKILIPLFSGIGIFLYCTQSYSQLPSYLPTNGLVAWYPFNGNANDESGNGNDGVVSNAQLTSDRFGNTNSAFDFNGISSHIRVPHSAELNLLPITISAWFREETALDRGQFLVSKYPCQSFNGYSMHLNSGHPSAFYYSFNDFGSIINLDGQSTSLPIATSGVWHCLTLSISESIFTYYLDGTVILQSTFSGTSGFVTNTLSDLYFGKYAGPCIDYVPEELYYMLGQIDDIAIYNRALTESEVQSLYTNQSTPPTNLCTSLPSGLQEGLVGYWPFCGNANDVSGNGNDGVVNGATPVADRFGVANRAYSFNGLTDYVLVPHSSSLDITGDNLTISAWVRGTGIQVVSKATEASPDARKYGMYVMGSGLGFELQTNEGPFDFSYGYVNPDFWSHLLVKYDGQTMFWYINNELVQTVPKTGSIVASNTNMSIGIFSDLAQSFFNGIIDDVCIWNRALSEAEISGLYSATSSNENDGSEGGSNNNAPPGIPYQAEVRNENGEVLANATVNIRFTLHELTANGTVSYQETHALTTNEIGLFAATIGAGTIGAGTIGAGSATQGTFAGINWAQTTKFLQVEVDTGNGWITMGNQQLMSVPYAQYSQKARKLETTGLPVFENNEQAIAGGLQAGELYRTSLGDLKVVY